MTIKIAINGFGRIGRCVTRHLFENNVEDVELVAINGPANLEQHASLFKYDSVHGRFSGTVEIYEQGLIINGKKIKFYHERDLNNITWDKDVTVLECSGRFTTRNTAAIHLERGAKRVMVSAPCKDADSTIVYDVNNDKLSSTDKVISIGSCTTNCLAPIAKIMNDNFGIESGFATTIHSYTNDQNLMDGSHKDLRRARAAALSMIPTSTGAAKALKLVIPELDGKIGGAAIRVPTPNVSVVDLTFKSLKETSVEEVNAAVKKARDNEMKLVIDYAYDKIVSIDVNHTEFSAVFDPFETSVTGKSFVRVLAWYDNEWAFSIRMIDVLKIWK